MHAVRAEVPNPKQSRSLAAGSSVHLDALRGFAAISVLLNHWRDALFIDYPSLGHHNPLITAAYLLTGLGRQWVIVFFVMSGYLVGGSVLRAVGSQRWSWRNYLSARLTRLYIVLLPALVLGACFDGAGIHLPGAKELYAGHSGMHALTVDVPSRLNLQTFACNGAFLQTIFVPGSHSGPVPTFGTNGPLWSLANEFWYYLAFPLLVLMLARGRAIWIRITCALGLAIWGWFVGSSIMLLGIPWLFGVLICYLPKLPPIRPWARVLMGLGAFALLCGSLLLAKLSPGFTTELVLGLDVALTIWLVLCFSNSLAHPWYRSLSQRLARSSYTLYLVHFPLLIFFKAVLHLPRSGLNWSSIAIGLGVLVLVFICAQLVYECFEKHTDRVRKWITLRLESGKLSQTVTAR